MIEDLIGLSSMATSRLLADLARTLADEQEFAVRFSSAGGVEVARRVRDGEEADLVVLADTAMAGLDHDGFLVSGTLRPLFVSDVVAAVPDHQEPPALATEGDLAMALVAARRIAYSTGPSGDALVRLVEDWGLADRVAAHLVQAPPGTPVGALLADGEADLGFQQRSELTGIAGVRVVGPLPGAAAIRSTFSGGVLSSSAHPAAAAGALRRLGSPDGEAAVRARGMQLARGAAGPDR